MLSAREAAFLSLNKIIYEGKYSNIETDVTVKRENLGGNEKNLYVRMVYGTLERMITLDFVLSHFSKTPLAKIEKKVLNILRLGAYQILYLDGVPDSAACNESVKLVKQYSHKGADGFVNGVLRNISRNKENLPKPDEKDRLSVEYSCPHGIVDILVKDYGNEKAEKILGAMFIQPRITIHVNTLKTDRETLCGLIPSHTADGCATALILDEGGADGLMEVIGKGLCFVQDVSSQLCAAAVDARPGMTVVDTCACPGGKSFAMALDMKNEGKIYSFDLHESKLSLIRDGAEKLGIGIIEPMQCDGEKGREELFGKADRVLCDVPCSGLGVMAKKPELRFKKTEDIGKLPDIQYRILTASSSYLKSGGNLVYSTCTLCRAENGDNVRRFLASNPDYELAEEHTLFPTEDSDGFYYAEMIKK